MGFSGGGSNVLKPHKHSSAVQDGSPLNMNNVTEATLSAGDVIYSDGAALQRLAIGSAADTLLVNGAANAPEWATPAAGGPVLNKIENETSTDQSLTSSSFVTITDGQIQTSNVVGKCVIQFSTYWQIDSGNMDVRFSMSTDGDTTPQRGSTHTHGNLKRHFYQGSVSETLAAQTIDVQIAIISGGTANIAVDDESPTNFTILEIS